MDTITLQNLININMKYSLVCLLIIIAITSCGTIDCKKRVLDVYNDIPEKGIQSFWNIDIERRGSTTFIFRDNQNRLLVQYLNDSLIIDTLIQRETRSPISCLVNRNSEELTNAVRNLSHLKVKRIRGVILDECRIVELRLNEDLLMYYVPITENSNCLIKETLTSKAERINDEWFYVCNGASIW